MKTRPSIRRVLLTLALACTASASALAGDWPTYRGGPGRGGLASDSIPAKPALLWTHRPPHAPSPAWSGRDTRMPFDRAHHPVVAGESLFFGGSVDGKVYALDVATGSVRWSFFCDAPVRFPPTAWNDRLFAVSDDGFLYCLAAADGRLLWKLRGGPRPDLVLGNERLVSRWPARGAPAVADGVVYFAAGIWPSEGIYVYAVDADSGKVLWCNDQAGGITMGQPHGGATAKSGVSAQGHLAIAGDVLLVPTGRAIPAAFRRADGEFLYFHLQANAKYGGSPIAVAGEVFFNGKAVFDVATGARSPAIPGLSPDSMAVTPDGIIHGQSGSVRSLHWAEVETKDRKGTVTVATGLKEDWTVPVAYAGTSLIVAGRTIVSAGSGKGGSAAGGYGVSTVDIASKQPGWSEKVDGVPWGLAAAGGRLFVATEQGTIYCFGDGPNRDNRQANPEKAANLEKTADRENGHPAAQAAEAILRQFPLIEGHPLAEGHCLDLGCGDGHLAEILAKETKLYIHAIDPDPENVALARKRLENAGLYGTRVTVRQGDPAKTYYPDAIADLVVSGRSATGELPADRIEEASRLARPYGGVVCLGKPDAMEKTVRGPLEGAGSWTHQYCDPANSNCSTDLVSGPLEMRWFTDFGFPMPSRHGRGRAPLFLDGRLFIEGTDAVLCVNAYNSRKLWERPLPGIQTVFDGDHLMGVSGTGSNFCIGEHGLYVHTDDKCLRLDPVTGKTLAQFSAPDGPDGTPGTWGVIACQDDTLFGTLAVTEHLVTHRYGRGDMRTQYTESQLLFAADAETGKLKWRYQPKHSIRHNAIAIGNGRVHLIDRPMATGDRHLEKKRGVPNPDDQHPEGTLVTLDAADGRILWQSDQDIVGTMLALSPTHDILLACYQDWRFKLASERGGKMTAFDAANGQRRWEIEGKFITRPIINGRTIYFQPGAWDLLTGEPTGFTFERSYGCGIPAGSRHLMVFRSATLGYLDLLGDRGTENYGGIRPGCWINTLPVGGLVLMPDAVDRCTCSYLIKASIALGPPSH